MSVHRIRLNIGFALAFLVLSSGRSASQTPMESPGTSVLAGPVIGFGSGLLRAGVPVYAGSQECGEFESGDFISPWIGGMLVLPRLFAADIGLALSVGWEPLRGYLTAEPVNIGRGIDPGNGEFVVLDREYGLRLDGSLLSSQIAIRWAPADRWHFAGGLTLAVPIGANSTQIDTVLGPGSLAFEGGLRSREMADGPDLVFEPILFGAAIVVGYDLPIGGGTRLVPQLRFRGDATSLVESYGLRRFSATASLALLFDLSPTPILLPPDTITPPLAPPPSLIASINISGMDNKGDSTGHAEVTMRRTLYRRYMPLLPAIFYDRDSDILAARYITDINTPLPTVASGLDLVQLYRHTLAIIGRRMIEHPSARLTLYGSTSSDEPDALAAERAYRLRDRLADAWGIPASRIVVALSPGPMKRSAETTEDGRQENRRVVITATDPRILAPIVVEEEGLEFNPPAVILRPEMVADAGVKRWRIILRQDERVVAEYSSEDSNASTELAWNIRSNPGDTAMASIVAELIVEDSAGSVVHAIDELPVIVRQRHGVIDRLGDQQGGKSIYTMVAFDYNGIEPGESDREILRDIAERIAREGHVTVIGFTDRIGDPLYNTGLSRRRGERVADVLRSFAGGRDAFNIDIEVEGEGISTGRFTNDLPEGRIFSRGVRVEVEWNSGGE